MADKPKHQDLTLWQCRRCWGEQFETDPCPRCQYCNVALQVKHPKRPSETGD